MHMQWYISSDREVHQLQVSNGKWHLFEVIRHDSSVNHHQIRIVYFLTLYKVLLYSIQYQPCKVQSTHVHDRGILFQLTKHFWHSSWLTKCDMVPQAQVIWGNVTSMMANTGEIYQVCCWCIYEFCLGPNFILIVPYLVTNGGTIITIAYTLAERGPMLCTAEMSPSITASKLKYLPADGQTLNLFGNPPISVWYTSMRTSRGWSTVIKSVRDLRLAICGSTPPNLFNPQAVSPVCSLMDSEMWEIKFPTPTLYGTVHSNMSLSSLVPSKSSSTNSKSAFWHGTPNARWTNASLHSVPLDMCTMMRSIIVRSALRILYRTCLKQSMCGTEANMVDPQWTIGVEASTDHSNFQYTLYPSWWC